MPQKIFHFVKGRVPLSLAGALFLRLPKLFVRSMLEFVRNRIHMQLGSSIEQYGKGFPCAVKFAAHRV